MEKRALKVSELRQVLERLQLGGPRSEKRLDDAALLARFVASHDPTAFETLLDRHGPMVWRVCRQLLSDLHAAEDAFQATWLVLVRKAASIDRPRLLGSWLYGVASRVAVRARAQTLRRKATEGGDVEAASSVPPLNPIVVEESRILHEELSRLPSHYRLPLVLCYLEGRKQEEAAALLGCSRTVLRGRLERGRLRLRARLERRGLSLATATLSLLGLERGAEAGLPAALFQATRAAGACAARQGLTTGIANAAAVTLAKGVCRMMFLAKVRLVLVFLLLAGLCGGAALVAEQNKKGPPAAPPLAEEKSPPRGPKLAENKPAPAAPENRAEAYRRAEAAVEELEKQLEDSEQLWMNELVKERVALLSLEEDLRKLERQQRWERGKMETRLKETQTKTAEAKKGLEVSVENSEAHDAFRKHLKIAQTEQAQVESEVRDQEKALNHKVIGIRKLMLESQLRVELLERRQARKRQRLEADLDRAVQRARSLQGSGEETPSSQLERKLDRLLHEVEALRREAKTSKP